ncbi:MAG: zinc permease [Cyclobacteriaceae bacterium]
MIISIIVLLLATVLGGLAANFVGYNPKTIKLPLVFGGSFLFAVTIIHILPELFTLASDPFAVGIYVLIGFFIQQLLEYLTSGIEHGHVHHHHDINKFSLLAGLIIHSLMEGALLNHDSPLHGQHEAYTLLLGIILHKAPAAFALMSVFKNGKRISQNQLLILLIFAVASPIGLLSSAYIDFSSETFLILFALVSGAFLHISTTIFIETSPEHKPGGIRMLIITLGVILGILAEYFL